MTTHKLEDLLDEIQEDEVVDILLDTNELKGLLQAVATYYPYHSEYGEAEVQSFLRILQAKALSIREELVRKKYPTDFSS